MLNLENRSGTFAIRRISSRLALVLITLSIAFTPANSFGQAADAVSDAAGAAGEAVGDAAGSVTDSISNLIPSGALDKLKTDVFSDYLPRIGKALAILIIGWLVAMAISIAVRWAIAKTGLNKQLAKVMPGKNGKGPNAGKMIGKGIFYFIMLFVVVAFLQALELEMVSGPLTGFLDQVMEYFPKLIGAGVLGAVAWVLATVVKSVSKSGLDGMDLDSKLNFGDEVVDENGGFATHADASGGMGLSTTISEVLYWLVFLLFLPAILGALQMPALLDPIQGMMTKAMDFLPNLIGAGVIGGVGFFVANIVKKIVTNLLAAAGADRAVAKAGLGDTKISGLAGTICHALILLPVIVAALNALKIDAVTEPASAMLNQITGRIPGVFAAAIVVGISYFVGKIVANLVTDVLSGAGFDKVPEKLGFSASATEGSTPPSSLVGKLIMAAMLFFAGMQAMNFLGLEMVAVEMQNFLGFFFNILIGVVVLGFGMYLANMAGEAIKSAGGKNADTLSKVAKGAIMVLAGFMGIQRMGLADSIVNQAFGLTLGAFAVAAAIAFGWGGRDAAKRILDKYVA